MAIYPEQESLLEAVVDGSCFQVDDLPAVPEAMRKPPRARSDVENNLGLSDWQTLE